MPSVRRDLILLKRLESLSELLPISLSIMLAQIFFTNSSSAASSYAIVDLIISFK